MMKGWSLPREDGADQMITAEENKKDEFKEHSRKNSTRQLVYVGMFAAVMAVLSQISIPMPSGIPVTLQTFAMALTGVVLGCKFGTAATVIYISLGAVGVPVFAGFMGGFSRIVGYTGGFIYGFLFLTFSCGVRVNRKQKRFMANICIAMLGLALCHVCGIIQYAVLSGQSIMEAFLLISAPYLMKDVVFVVLAIVLGTKMTKHMKRANLM